MAALGSGLSVISASVVRIIAAIEAAFSTAERVTLAGSMMPALEHVDVLVRSARRSRAFLLFCSACAATNVLDHDRAVQAGVRGELAHRLLERRRRIVHAGLVVALELERRRARPAALISATPPPGTMPSSTAARVAESASSTRCFFSLSSVSVAAPTLMTATPPDSLARRSWSFSWS